MIEPNTDKILNLLMKESEDNSNWNIDLDCFILKIIPIPATELLWVIASEEHVFLLNSSNGKIVKKFKNVAELIFSGVIHPISNYLFISTSSGVFLLNTQGDIINLVNEADWFEHICISLDGNILFAAKGKTLYIFKLKSNGYELINQDNSFDSTISDIIFNIDSFLVSNYGSVREYRTKDLKNYNIFEWKTSLLTLSWSSNKKYIAAGTQENNIHFWPYPFVKDTDFQISGYPTKINKIIWANNSTELIINCFDDVQIWDFSNGPPTGKQPLTLKCGLGKITDIKYNGDLLVAANEKGFIFYFRPSHSEEFVQMHSINDEISCIDLNETENQLYVGSKSGLVSNFEINF